MCFTIALPSFAWHPCFSIVFAPFAYPPVIHVSLSPLHGTLVSQSSFLRLHMHPSFTCPCLPCMAPLFLNRLFPVCDPPIIYMSLSPLHGTLVSQSSFPRLHILPSFTRPSLPCTAPLFLNRFSLGCAPTIDYKLSSRALQGIPCSAPKPSCVHNPKIFRFLHPKIRRSPSANIHNPLSQVLISSPRPSHTDPCIRTNSNILTIKPEILTVKS
jgi:hypothetical protein